MPAAQEELRPHRNDGDRGVTLVTPAEEAHVIALWTAGTETAAIARIQGASISRRK
jgi:hypothetical protein